MPGSPRLTKPLPKLVALKVITQDDHIRLTRKFMDDRPEFKQHVAEAMGGKVIAK